MCGRAVRRRRRRHEARRLRRPLGRRRRGPCVGSCASNPTASPTPRSSSCGTTSVRAPRSGCRCSWFRRRSPCSRRFRSRRTASSIVRRCRRRSGKSRAAQRSSSRRRRLPRSWPRSGSGSSASSVSVTKTTSSGSAATRCSPLGPSRRFVNGSESRSRCVRSSSTRRSTRSRRRWRRSPATSYGEADTSTTAPARRTYPPAFSQRPLLIVDELADETATYNGAFALKVVGELDPDALQAALAGVVARHEALRTVFTWDSDEPEQVVLEDWQSALPVTDLTSYPAEQREAELQLRLRTELRRPFDLARDLLVRTTLFRLSESEHVLLVVTHHIASDGWSVGIFCRDLGELYEARRAAAAAPTSGATAPVSRLCDLAAGTPVG